MSSTLNDRPNILLLTVDALRADMLSCYGHRVSTTPNIDQLAASGVRFEQAITGGSWTQAAFPVLLTSTYASMYGGCLGPLALERPSPIEVMASEGYTTGGFSTSPLLSRAYGYDRGFHHFMELVPDESDPTLRNVRGGERILRNPLFHHVSRLLGKRTRPARLYVSAAELIDEVYRWLDAVEEPFFAWVHFMDTHWPYHREETLNAPMDTAQAWKDLAHLHRANWHGAKITPAQRERYIQLYEQALIYTDAQIGQLIGRMDEFGYLDETIIVVISDHGEEFLERGRWGHFESNLYDEILKVPLIIGMPSLATGHVIRNQVRTLDLMPTILELCGCPPPDGLEGASLVPLWLSREGGYDVEESLSEMWRENHHIVAIRTEMFKYIWDSRQPRKPRLYNLQADPGEQQNVHEHYPEQSRQLQSRVHTHRRRVASHAEMLNRSAEPTPDAEMLVRLRGLGYIE